MKLSKKNLNPRIHLSEGNIKSKNTDDIMFLTWSLPSRKTCPYATATCKKKCFAKKNETFETVRNSRYRHLEETKKQTFVNDMIQHFEYQLQRKKTKDKKIFVRIHTSGDFYGFDYFAKWVQIAEYFKGNKKIFFQCYTKSIPILRKYLGSSRINVDDINIHFVWSIWNDTPKEYTEYAKQIGLQTFTALPKDQIEKAVESGAFYCDGDCGNCRQCYTGKIKEVVIPYH